MRKYRVYVEETHYLTYEINVPEDLPEEDVPSYFYNASNEQQKLLFDDVYTWEVKEAERYDHASLSD